MSWHWLRHDWSKWEQYVENGWYYLADGFLKYDTSRPHQIEQVRQRRTCKTCGKLQDEVVR